MLTLNLEKRLIARKSDSLYTKEEQLLIKEANSILEKNVDSDVEILSKMGLDYAVRRKENIEKRKDFLKGLDRSRIFSIQEINSLCVAYRLKFLPIGNYKGSIDPNLPDKIKEFQTLYESTRTSKMNFRDFEICAPQESFKLEEHPIDPLLFYPIGGDFYYLVHKWGNDISIFRWFKALKMRSYWSWFVVHTLQLWVPIALISTFVFKWHWAISFAYLGGALINFLFARYWEGDYTTGWLARRVSQKNWRNNRNME